MEQKHRRNLIFVSIAQCGMAFCANFIISTMPFYIFKISPYSARETLLWVGAIMGVTHFVTTVASNLWGALTSRFSPKLLFMRGILIHTILFALMGFTSSLPFLFALRVIQGLIGGISTIGLIIVSASSSRENISADIGFYQMMLQLGLLLGPPVGALAASVFGYRGAFVSAAAVLMVFLAFCHFYVTDIPLQAGGEKFMGRDTFNRRSILGWLLCFTCTVQLMFLPSILPKILERFRVEQTTALRWAGLIIFLYSTTATLGIYVWTRLARRYGRNRMILFLAVTGTLFQLGLSLNRGVVDFVVVRMIQTGLIAACVPLVVSVFATGGKGGTIGFLNSGRFAGNAFGSIIATSVLAISTVTSLYLVIAAMTLAALTGFRLAHAAEEAKGKMP